jgi:predicted RNA-binding Zn-ribbon protein involved in translation (DUF1610 family)
VAGRVLLKQISVAENYFQAEAFVPSKADSLCSVCSMWGHSEFRCYRRKPASGSCVGEYRTAEHNYEVVTYKALPRMCQHTAVKCPNCGEAYQVQDRRCRMKAAPIEIARGPMPYLRRPRTTLAPEAVTTSNETTQRIEAPNQQIGERWRLRSPPLRTQLRTPQLRTPQLRTTPK